MAERCQTSPSGRRAVTDSPTGRRRRRRRRRARRRARRRPRRRRRRRRRRRLAALRLRLRINRDCARVTLSGREMSRSTPLFSPPSRLGGSAQPRGLRAVRLSPRRFLAGLCLLPCAPCSRRAAPPLLSAAARPPARAGHVGHQRRAGPHARADAAAGAGRRARAGGRRALRHSGRGQLHEQRGRRRGPSLPAAAAAAARARRQRRAAVPPPPTLCAVRRPSLPPPRRCRKRRARRRRRLRATSTCCA
jgi:hypothetical protein